MRAALLFLLLLIPGLPYAAPAEPETTPPLSAPAGSLPAAARPEKKTSKPERFRQLHESFLKRAKEGPIDLLFLGDSITEKWTSAPAVWKRYYAKRNAANFGVGGDRTQNVLWRIQEGRELEGISPKVVVLMIGTNNSHRDTPEDIATGIEQIVRTLRRKLPESKILLLGIFPRGTRNPASRAPEVVKEVNQIISKLHDGKMVHYLDIGDSLLINGKLSKQIMPDQLHLSEKGYAAWAKAMEPTLQKLLE